MRRIQPPPVNPASPPDEPDPVLTPAAYQGLEVLVDVYSTKKPRQPVLAQFWRLVLDTLHEASIAPLWMATTIENGLSDDLAYMYDAEGWREEAAGWRRVGHAIGARGYAREGRDHPFAGLNT